MKACYMKTKGSPGKLTLITINLQNNAHQIAPVGVMFIEIVSSVPTIT